MFQYKDRPTFTPPIIQSTRIARHGRYLSQCFIISLGTMQRNKYKKYKVLCIYGVLPNGDLNENSYCGLNEFCVRERMDPNIIYSSFILSHFWHVLFAITTAARRDVVRGLAGRIGSTKQSRWLLFFVFNGCLFYFAGTQNDTTRRDNQGTT